MLSSAFSKDEHWKSVLKPMISAKNLAQRDSIGEMYSTFFFLFWAYFILFYKKAELTHQKESIEK